MDGVYIGIDLGDEYAMISSYCVKQDKEPETVSTVAGSEKYQIPVLLAKRPSIGQWYYGDEARRMAKASEMICVDHLLRRALDEENIRVENENYSARDLLLLFIQKIVLLPQMLGNTSRFTRLIITVEKLTKENMELFWGIAQEMELTREEFSVIDHKAAFYYYVFHQQKELWVQDAVLFSCVNDSLMSYTLKRNRNTVPQMVSISEERHGRLGEQRDLQFQSVTQKMFEGRAVSSVYLVGEGFDGGWLDASLKFLCRGRRVFMGKNLFTKGACYAGEIADSSNNWKYVYMGENEMKFNLSLKVKKAGKPAFWELISAGKNWFEICGECEVILDDLPKIDFWKQMPNSRDAKLETLELTDLPERPPKTTRLRITAQPVSDDRVEIIIRDMGFGEFFRGTGKSWKYTMTI